MIAPDKWRQVWIIAFARAAKLQTKKEQIPLTARQRSEKENA
jgi:hypothetical protein